MLCSGREFRSRLPGCIRSFPSNSCFWYTKVSCFRNSEDCSCFYAPSCSVCKIPLNIASCFSPGVGLRNPETSGGKLPVAMDQHSICFQGICNFSQTCFHIYAVELGLCALSEFMHPAVDALSFADPPAWRMPKVSVLHMCQNGRQEGLMLGRRQSVAMHVG